MKLLRAAVLLPLLAILIPACGHHNRRPEQKVDPTTGQPLLPCAALLKKAKKTIDGIRGKCCKGKKLAVKCDPKLKIPGETTRDENGNVTVRLQPSISLSTLRHELIHAIDKCMKISESVKQFTVGAGDPANLKMLKTLLALLFSEYIAQMLGDDIPVKLKFTGFPNPDKEDRCFLKAYDTLVYLIVDSELKGKTKEFIRELLTQAGLGPGNLKPNDEDYKNWKKKFKEFLDGILKDTSDRMKKFKDCVKAVQALK